MYNNITGMRARAWLADTKGFYFSPENDGAGGAGGGGGSTENKEEKKDEKQEEKKEEEFDVTKVDAKTKAYFDKLVADSVAAAATAAAERAKTETLAQIDKDKKAAERKAAKDAATETGNAAEVARLAAEETALLKAEAAADRAAAKADRDTATKLRIANEFKLPAGYESRILGATEAEWLTDAETLSKEFKGTHKTSETEGTSRDVKTTPKEVEESARKHVRGTINF